ncbi:hypothetical protein [Actinokineospora inagensis]|uniref:hypothetical protein n=1 Tax=Actinokineospora inagensis TaxID=103730 RepID=UPI00146FC089|nr:hypothetical protein [Actinokineospora inagensis]
MSVETWVDLAHDVPMRMDASGVDQATLHFGQGDEYSMTMNRANLTQLVDLATQAIAALDAA